MTLFFREYLDNLKFPQERAEFFCQRYVEKLNALRENLSQTQFQFPHVVDVQWRLDYLIKSNAVERIDQPIYLIKLKTKQSPGGENKELEFACTLEQMQDLVAKLKDAEHALERQDFV
jgi:polycomb group RING finger protein 4